jgi:FKBP-type peptidyl-prolyl cis-trans isomerase
MQNALPSHRATVPRPLHFALATLVIIGCATFGAYAQAPAPGATAGASKLDANVTVLQKNDVKQGHGTEAQAGKTVVVHYTGWLYDPAQPGGKGKKFDSSRDRGEPFAFPLGAGRVIRGWDEGVAGMKVGGERTLVIPPAMGYGARGAGGVIPPNATLLFDVELLDVK